MRSIFGFRRLAISGMVVMSGLLAIPGDTARAQSVTYSGRAYALGLTGVTYTGKAISSQFVADTGSLPAEGGSKSVEEGTLTVPGVTNDSPLGSVTVRKESTNGANEVSTAVSRVAGLTLIPLTPDLIDALGTGIDDLGRAQVRGADVRSRQGTFRPHALVTAGILDADTNVGLKGSPGLASSVATMSVGPLTMSVPTRPNARVSILDPVSGSAVVNMSFGAQSYDSTRNLASASSLVLDFPADGMLNRLLTGTITVSHAEAGIEAAPALPRTGVNSPPAGRPFLPLAPWLLAAAGACLLIRRRSLGGR